MLKSSCCRGINSIDVRELALHSPRRPPPEYIHNYPILASPGWLAYPYYPQPGQVKLLSSQQVQGSPTAHRQATKEFLCCNFASMDLHFSENTHMSILERTRVT